MAEKDPNYLPLCIFPEGCTTNGQYLLTYRRGGFQGLKAVQPVYCKYWAPMIRPSIECVDIAALIVLAFCHGPYTCTVHSMPVFEPNEYLFETHKDKGKEKWEIFAWAIRDAMSK